MSRYDAVDGVRVHSLSAGVGPPLLLLHDLFFSSRSWPATLDASCGLVLPSLAGEG